MAEPRKRFWVWLFAGAVAMSTPFAIRALNIFPQYEAIGRCRSEPLLAPVPKLQLMRRTALGVAVSGGGSRAAYLTAAVLREIHSGGIRLIFPREETNNDRDLLDQIDAISAVSGGSFAAAYFVANIERLKKAEARSAIWEDYLEKMALNYRPREWFTFDPVTWLKMLLSDYNRGYLAREDYDRTLFNGATLADLPDRPAIFINSFDLANRVRFIFSKHEVDTSRYLTRYFSKFQVDASKAAKDIVFEIESTYLHANSIKLSDAIAASSAYPLAYPNIAVKGCNLNIGGFVQGNLFFLADGGLADNSGLVTLLTRLHSAKTSMPRGSNVLVIYIDASTDQIASRGSSFQQRGIEEGYAWHDTIFGHGKESIEGAIDMLQEFNLRYIESIGVETSQLRSDWEELGDRTGRCILTGDASWYFPFESGEIALRPLVIRLGLRDLVDPLLNFEYKLYAPKGPRLIELLEKNGIQNGVDGIAEEPFAAKLRSIKTDFALSSSGRDALDLAAYLLVHGKLKPDLYEWDGIAGTHTRLPDRKKLRCDKSDLNRGIFKKREGIPF